MRKTLPNNTPRSTGTDSSAWFPAKAGMADHLVHFSKNGSRRRQTYGITEMILSMILIFAVMMAFLGMIFLPSIFWMVLTMITNERQTEHCARRFYIYLSR